MGILESAKDTFSNFKEQREKKKQQEENNRQQKRYNEACDLAASEKIRCDSDLDFEAMKIIADSFIKNRQIDGYSNISISDGSGSLDNDAIEDADANVYYFCKAIIYQNFMLIRKVDALSKRLDKFEKEHE